MKYEETIERIYEHLEEQHINKAVMGCLRIARHAKDYLNAAYFLRELYPVEKEFHRVLYDDTSDLKDEARKFLREKSSERWLETRQMQFSLVEDDDDSEDEGTKRNILAIGIGEVDGELDQWERAISDLAVPAGMSQFDTAAFTDRLYGEKANIRLRIKALQTVKSRIAARCLNYAIQMERQLEAQQKSQNFLESVQNEVNNFFKARSDDTYKALQKATHLALSPDTEDASLILTEVRRALKASADHFYPPNSSKIVCSDGKERILGEEQYLNRLQEFLSGLKNSKSRELLELELDLFSSFFRKLNDLASKGVHGAVSTVEARQGLVGLYFFLFNVCHHISQKSGQE